MIITKLILLFFLILFHTSTHGKASLNTLRGPNENGFLHFIDSGQRRLAFCQNETFQDADKCGTESVQCGTQTLALDGCPPDKIIEDISQCQLSVITDPLCGATMISDAIICGVDFVTDMTLCGVDTVTDAAKCGTEYITSAAKCGTEFVTDAAKCGTEFVTDGVKCGTQTVTSAAQCGIEYVTDAVRCGTKTVTSVADCGVDYITSGAECGWDYVANAAACGTKTVTSAADCGTDWVTDATICGTKYVSDGAVCGYDTVTSTAICGSKTITDGATCGWNWLKGLFGGKKPKSCSVPNTCKTPKSCNIAQSCSTPKTCTIAKSCNVAKSCNIPKTCEIAASCDIAKTCTVNLSCDIDVTCEIDASCDWPKTCEIAASCDIPKTCSSPKTCCTFCEVPKYCEVNATCDVLVCEDVSPLLQICLEETLAMLEATHYAYPNTTNISIMKLVIDNGIYLIDDFTDTTDTSPYESACSEEKGSLHELIYEAECVAVAENKTANLLVIKHPRCYDDTNCRGYDEDLFERFTLQPLEDQANLKEHSASDWSCTGTLLDSRSQTKCKYETDLLNTKVTSIVDANKMAMADVLSEKFLFIIPVRQKIVQFTYPAFSSGEPINVPVSKADASFSLGDPTAAPVSEAYTLRYLADFNETLNLVEGNETDDSFNEADDSTVEDAKPAGSLEEACTMGFLRAFDTLYAICDGSLYFELHDVEACLGQLCEDETEQHLAAVTGVALRNLLASKSVIGADVKSCVVSLDENPVPLWEKYWFWIVVGSVVGGGLVIILYLVCVADKEQAEKL